MAFQILPLFLDDSAAKQLANWLLDRHFQLGPQRLLKRGAAIR
jgi:hypothetical protein